MTLMFSINGKGKEYISHQSSCRSVASAVHLARILLPRMVWSISFLEQCSRAPPLFPPLLKRVSILSHDHAIIFLLLSCLHDISLQSDLTVCHRFTALQVKSLYWSFKNECPSGLVSQDTFHEIFSKLFPTGGCQVCQEVQGDHLLLQPT